ncbi:hypothetical protein FOYG_14161 [Fusarium oxysporum NRRL 32931]|uniref:Uncharacterized protein n=1 Tax=Fusarium oxysporum NRRL 32931 TaxID=660029 RepID=W9HPB2_FUSOX|nr:hypothetical protein FOYG_14161 [Fusarium oxysporum NRRL 32931]
MLGYSEPPGPRISWRVHFWSAKTLSGLRPTLKASERTIRRCRLRIFVRHKDIRRLCGKKKLFNSKNFTSILGLVCFLDPKRFRAGSAISPSSRQQNTDSSWKIRNLVTWDMIKTPVNTAGCQTIKTSSLPRSASTAGNYISTRAKAVCLSQQLR